jgi:hypothetical protein
MQLLRRSLSIALALLALCHCQSDRGPIRSAASAADSGMHEQHDAGVQSGAQAGRAATTLDAGRPKDAGPAPDAATKSGAAGSAPAASSGGASASAGQAGAGQPDAAQPDTAQPDAAQPNAAQPASGSTMIVGVNAWGLRARSPDGGAFVICRNPSTGDDHSPDLLRDVAYGDGVFIAVGGDLNSMVMRSLDAVHWQEDLHSSQGCSDSGYPSSCNNWMGGVAYGGGVWLAGGGNGALMRSRDAGLSWQGVHPKNTPNPIRHMAAGSGRFVAGADQGAVFVSQDAGDSWTRFDLWTGHSQAEGMRVAHGAGSFIAWGSWWNGSQIEQACFVSSDKGDHWKACAASVANSNSFVYDGTRWVTRAAGGYATSSDGVAWTMHAASGVPDELLFDGTTWFGRSGTSYSMGSSPDNWKTIPNVKVPDFRSWTIGRVLDANLPVMGIAACTDKG